MSILNNEITTPRQAKSGTRAFLCNRTGASYTSHANGYVRRQIHISARSSKGSSGQYQLNPVNVTKHSYNTKHNDKNFFCYTTTKRIMLNNESDRLGLIERRASSYKA